MAKYLTTSGGDLVEAQTVQSSAGAGDSGKIPGLDANGRLDTSMMPSGLGAENESIIASEALSAGDFVNVYNNSGTPTCRKADATASAKRAHGYVLSNVSNGAMALVYTDGKNDQVSGLTAGDVWLSAAVPGRATNTAPTGSGQIVQKLGVAVSATEVNFDPQAVILLV